MITGKYPFFLNMRVLHGDLDTAHVTAAEAMAAEGYFTCAIAEPWPTGFYQGFEVVDFQHHETTQKTQRCLQILKDLDERPFFIWLYYWDPHAPYQPPERYLELVDRAAAGPADFSPEERCLPAVRGSNLLLLAQLNRGAITLTEAQRSEMVRLYDGEIAFVDAGIGQVAAALKRMGLWDKTLVVLSADHGEAFGEHGLYYHSHSLYDEEVRVPCIVKPPHFGASGREIAGLVRNMDLSPTILDYCGVTAPENIQGRTLRPFIVSQQNPHLPSCLETHSAQQRRHLMAYRTEDYKLIDQVPAGATELYHLKADPKERNNLLAADPGGGQSSLELEDLLRREMLTALGVTSPAELELGNVTGMDPETREQLKALGYID